MLIRLLKYEIKATARKFLPLYAAIIVVSLFVNWGIRFPKLGIISGLSNFLLAALFVSLIAITLITIIQRFQNNLLTNEGYLMFTLPVSTKKLILSKLICAVVCAFLSLIVSVFSFLMISFSLGLITSIKDFIIQYSYYIELINRDHIILSAIGSVSIVMQFVYFVLLVYCSLSVSQLPVFNKHRGAASFLAFIIISVVANVLVQGIIKNIFPGITPGISVSDIRELILVFITALIINTSLSAIMFFATDYLLSNHLNLE